MHEKAANDLKGLTEEFKDALVHLNRIKADEILGKLYAAHQNINFLEELVTVTLEEIGKGWEDGTIALAQVYMSGVICEELMNRYLPEYGLTYKKEPRMAIAVLQDHHALGKRMVYSVLRAAGYDLFDFGHGLSVEQLVQETLNNKIEILLISTLMLPSALKVGEAVKMLRKKGSAAKIVVGGAPFRLNTGLGQKVKADAVGKSATDALAIVTSLVEGGKK